jgi:hypothetical protein
MSDFNEKDGLLDKIDLSDDLFTDSNDSPPTKFGVLPFGGEIPPFNGPIIEPLVGGDSRDLSVAVRASKKVPLPARRFFRFMSSEGFKMGFFHQLFQLYYCVDSSTIKFKARSIWAILSKVLTRKSYGDLLRGKYEKHDEFLNCLDKFSFRRRFLGLKEYITSSGLCIDSLSDVKVYTPFDNCFFSLHCHYDPQSDLFDMLFRFCCEVKCRLYEPLLLLDQDRINSLKARYNAHQFPCPNLNIPD